MKIIISLSAFIFIIYGCLCLLTDHMKGEFHRYNLSKFRTLVGVLEIFGGLGLLNGLNFPVVLTLASAGLAILMFLGTLVRIRIKDPFFEMLPAIILFLLNATIFTISL